MKTWFAQTDNAQTENSKLFVSTTQLFVIFYRSTPPITGNRPPTSVPNMGQGPPRPGAPHGGPVGPPQQRPGFPPQPPGGPGMPPGGQASMPNQRPGFPPSSQPSMGGPPQRPGFPPGPPGPGQPPTSASQVLNFSL